MEGQHTTTTAIADGAPDGTYDVIVIGAGAAGLLGAARSAERGRKTLLLEKNRKAGVKILISGGTRCNLTHHCDARGIVAAFGVAGSFLHSALAALSPAALVELFHREGVPTYVERGTDKVFPRSNRAVDVVQALVRRLARCGAELALGEPVREVARAGDGFLVTTSRRMLRSARLVVTTGGMSYPGCGTTGDGYAWLRGLGHTIRPPRPALVPLTCDEPWVRSLAGIALTDVLLRVVDVRPGGGRRRGGLPPGVRIQRRGAMLFTHFGLSGPAPMDVSREVTRPRDVDDVRLAVDFMPEETAAGLQTALQAAASAEGKKLVANVLPPVLPQRLGLSLMAQAGIPPQRRAAELSKAERGKLVAAIKNTVIKLSGTRGFPKAEVTAGGVALDEVDSRTMQSKLVPNLFLAGEILDLDGFIGGYNFQAAFSTGYVAGSNV